VNLHGPCAYMRHENLVSESITSVFTLQYAQDGRIVLVVRYLESILLS